MNVKDVKDMKDTLQEASQKGFGFFMKNVLMIVLLILIVFIFTNPNAITNPAEFFANFKLSSLWTVLILFLLFGGFYQLAKDVVSEKKVEENKETVEQYEYFLKTKEEEAKARHSALVKERFQVGPLISNELKNLLINLDADRAAILEMHNGTNNASGLPFIYGDMVYEEISPDVDFVSDEFKNINLAKLPFVALHYNEKTWIGARNDIEEEDKYFGAKLRLANVEYGAIIVLEGVNGPIGFLTLFFKDERKHPSKAKIIAELNHSSQIISNLLDKTK